MEPCKSCGTTRIKITIKKDVLGVWYQCKCAACKRKAARIMIPNEQLNEENIEHTKKVVKAMWDAEQKEENGTTN